MADHIPVSRTDPNWSGFDPLLPSSAPASLASYGAAVLRRAEVDEIKVPISPRPEGQPIHKNSENLPEQKVPSRPGPSRLVNGPVMSSRDAQKKMHNPPAKGWATWWPVAVGVALGCLAPLLRSLLVPYDPWGMRAVFPFVQFLGLHEIGMSDELTRTLPQLMLFLQFPLEGLLTKSTLSRGVKVSGALQQLFFLHFVSGLVLWVVALGTAR